MSHSIHMPSIQIETSSTTSNYPFFARHVKKIFHYVWLLDTLD